jgi:hypothetical protein
MPEDRVVITADAGQYFDVLSRAGVASDRLAGSGVRVGESFLRGDRAVRVATANITQGLFMANNAADATLITLQSLERVFRIPIGATIFAAGAIAAVEAISKIIEKEQKLREEIHALKLEATTGNAAFLGTDQISKNLTDSSAKIKEITDDLIGLRSGKGKFLGIDFMGSETRAFFEKQDEEKLAELRQGAVEDVLKLTSKQNDLNRVEMERLSGAEDQADLDKLAIDHNERLGKLLELTKNAQLQGTTAEEQLLSVENDRYNTAVAILKTKQEEVKLKESIKTANAITDFFADVGSGKFVKNFKTEQQREADAELGKQQIEEFRKARDAGIPLGPIAAAELRDADRLAKQEKTGLPALLNADFTNLLDLSRYDFSGLLPLSGLSISIQ